MIIENFVVLLYKTVTLLQNLNKEDTYERY